MGKRVEWFKWIIHYRMLKVRVQQISLVFSFEVYYQLCKLRGYPVTHVLERWGSPAPEGAKSREGKYIAVWPRLPLSIRLLDRIFPFARYYHAECIDYTPERAEEIKQSRRRAELVEIWTEFRSIGNN